MPLRSLRFVLVVALVVAAIGAGCDRPLAVTVDAAGARKLALRGEVGVEGVTTRTLLFAGSELPKGTALKVRETWVVRKDGGKPPAVRVTGAYDPAKDGAAFSLPDGAADLYYACLVGPDFQRERPIPAEAFERR